MDDTRNSKNNVIIVISWLFYSSLTILYLIILLIEGVSDILYLYVYYSQ